MAIADSNLPRWMQGNWASQAPLRGAQPAVCDPKRPTTRNAQQFPAAKASQSDDRSLLELARALPQDAVSPPSRPATRPTTRIVYRREPPPKAQRGPVSWLSAMILAFIATIVFATQGLATAERGLTVRLPAAEPMPEAATLPGEGTATGGETPDLLTPSEALRLSPEEAEAVRTALRAELPATGYHGPRPSGWAVRGATSGDNERALMCLTQAVYYEAANETEAGQRAVAQVVLNRVRHPDYPSSVCGVVYQGSERATGCQFTFTCDGALARSPMQSKWSRARRIAREALGGRAFGDVGFATHYHTFEVWPYWGRTLTMTNMIGRHIFHRLRGRGGSPGYFTERYSGRESGPRPWRPRPAQDAADNALAEVVAAASRAAEVQTAQEPNNLPPAPVARNESSRAAVPQRVREANNLPDSRIREDALPDSQIRPEFRDSGRRIGG